MRRFIPLLSFSLLISQIGIAQWHPQKQSITDKALNDVILVDENIGWAVGDSGTIIKTTNGGTVWIMQECGIHYNLHGVYFSNTNNGWVVGDNGIIIKTSNGGTNWILQNNDDSIFLNTIWFIDENNGWAVGGGLNTAKGLILKTTDGGAAWEDQIVSMTFQLNDICFLNADTGFIAAGNTGMGSHGAIFRTTDGGINWIEQLYSMFIDWQGIAFWDELNGITVGRDCYIGCDGNIYKTTDGGTTWEYIYSRWGGFNNIILADLGYAWIVSSKSFLDDARILFTSDRGSNWFSQSEFSKTLNSIYLINSSNGWAVGDSGIILHTTNGGITFISENQINNIPADYFLSNNYPNPFNPNTTIQYSLPNSSNVVIKVFDILGNEIETLINDEKNAGTYELTWNAAKFSSGIYFYIIKAGSFIQTKKMILMK